MESKEIYTPLAISHNQALPPNRVQRRRTTENEYEFVSNSYKFAPTTIIPAQKEFITV